MSYRLATIHTAYSTFIATLFEKFETVLEEMKCKNSNWIPFEWWKTMTAWRGGKDSRNKLRHRSLFKHFCTFCSEICKTWSDFKWKQQVELKLFWKKFCLSVENFIWLILFQRLSNEVRKKVKLRKKRRKTSIKEDEYRQDCSEKNWNRIDSEKMTSVGTIEAIPHNYSLSYSMQRMHTLKAWIRITQNGIN